MAETLERDTRTGQTTRAPFAGALVRARRSGALLPAALLVTVIALLLPHLAASVERFDGADLLVGSLLAWLIARLARIGRRDG